MEKIKKTTGLSRDYIIHPGETLAEVLEDRDLKQSDLAIKTGRTDKHISKVINGKSKISADFARRLEYALGINSEFWLNLQNRYDLEIAEYEELHNISKEELEIFKTLKMVVLKFIELGLIKDNQDEIFNLIDLRKILQISNLVNISNIKLKYNGAFRVGKKTVDDNILYAWVKMCEQLTKNIIPSKELDIERLKKKIPEIKQIMFKEEEEIEESLSTLFIDCGIVFKIVPNFTGAPVQGYIKNRPDGTLILCLTLRGKAKDIFWFTLFHEIAHILNNDYKNESFYFRIDSIDSDNNIKDPKEEKADLFARDILINPVDYKDFEDNKKYEDSDEIKRFAESQNVPTYIIQGRLMNDGHLNWKNRHNFKNIFV